MKTDVKLSGRVIRGEMLRTYSVRSYHVATEILPLHRLSSHLNVIHPFQLSSLLFDSLSSVCLVTLVFPTAITPIGQTRAWELAVRERSGGTADVLEGVGVPVFAPRGFKAVVCFFALLVGVCWKC